MGISVFDSESGVPIANPGIHGGLEDREAIANRAPRYALKVPVRFRSMDGLVLGETVDIRASGMLVRFDREVDVWLAGELSTSVHAHPLNLRVRAIRSDGKMTGVAFQIRTDADREALKELMAVAVEQGEFVAPTP